MSDDDVHPRDLLSAYLDDELPIEDRAVVDRHLAGCEDCRVQLAALGRLAHAIADERVPPLPDDLIEKTGRRLDEATLLRPKRFGFAIPATIAATIAVIGILVAVRWREGGVLAPPPPLVEEKQSTEVQSPAEPVPPAPPQSPSARSTLADKPVDLLEKAKKKDVKENAAPDAEADRQSRDESASNVPAESADGAPEGVAGGAAGGVVGGVVGGVEGGAEGAAAPEGYGEKRRERADANAPTTPAPSAMPSRFAAAKAMLVSPCTDRWSDSGARGRWIVDDVERAAAELARIARDAGGSSIWRGAADGRPCVLAVPRDHLAEVLAILRARGIGGLETVPTLPPGDDCTGISIELTAR